VAQVEDLAAETPVRRKHLLHEMPDKMPGEMPAAKAETQAEGDETKRQQRPRDESRGDRDAPPGREQSRYYKRPRLGVQDRMALVREQ